MYDSWKKAERWAPEVILPAQSMEPPVPYILTLNTSDPLGGDCVPYDPLAKSAHLWYAPRDPQSESGLHSQSRP